MNRSPVLTFFWILVFLTSCKSQYVAIRSELIYFTPDTGLPSDTVAVKILHPYRTEMQTKMGDTLAYSVSLLEKGVPESDLGNFVADLCLSAAMNQTGNKSTGLYFCILNNGGLRSVLPAGPVLLRHAFELMPFDNELVVVTLSGDAMDSLFSYIASKGGVPVSGIKLRIVNGQSTDIYIQGEPFERNKNYHVVTSDYLASGGDAMTMFSDRVHIEKTGIRVRDAIIDHLKWLNGKNEMVKAGKDGRISY